MELPPEDVLRDILPTLDKSLNADACIETLRRVLITICGHGKINPEVIAISIDWMKEVVNDPMTNWNHPPPGKEVLNTWAKLTAVDILRLMMDLQEQQTNERYPRPLTPNAER